MRLNRRKCDTVNGVISAWQQQGIISSEEAARLKGTVEASGFDWRRLATYAYWIAGLSLAISFFSFVFDKAVLRIIEKIFHASDVLKSIVLALVGASFYSWAFRRKRRAPEKTFSNEFILIAGALACGGCLAFLGSALRSGRGHYPPLILAASLIYLALGWIFPSRALWVIGLISLGSWLGTESGYVSGWGDYFLGMNYPLRFVAFGIFLLAAYFMLRKSSLRHVGKPTYVFGLLNLFIALWIMSIFGNYGDMSKWHAAHGLELLMWSLIFGAVALAAIIWSLKTDDRTARGFGLTFIIINLYTKYFEYIWEPMRAEWTSSLRTTRAPIPRDFGAMAVSSAFSKLRGPSESETRGGL